MPPQARSAMRPGKVFSSRAQPHQPPGGGQAASNVPFSSPGLPEAGGRPPQQGQGSDWNRNRSHSGYIHRSFSQGPPPLLTGSSSKATQPTQQARHLPEQKGTQVSLPG